MVWPATVPASRILIRQADACDLEGVLRVCECHAEYWDGRLPLEIRLNEYFDRALSSQDDVFQFWIAEDGRGAIVGWEMLAANSSDPARRRLTGEATTCLGRPSGSLGRTLVTHAIRHAARTPLQYLFAQVPTRDALMVSVLESVGYREVGLIPAVDKHPAQPERLEFVYVLSH